MKKSKTKVVSKIFSLLLTVFMLNSMIWIPSVSATQWNSFVTHFCASGSSTDTYLTNDGTSTKTNEKGVGGKGETDISIRWQANNGATTTFLSVGYVREWIKMLETGTDKVYVCSFNVYPVQGLNKAQIATNANVPLSAEIPNAALKQGQWNRIACVYDRDKSEYGTNTLYINGKQYGEPFVLSQNAYEAMQSNMNNDPTKPIVTYRPIFNLNAGADVYADDFAVWQAARTAEYTGVPYVTGDFVFEDVISPGTTPAQIKTATASGIKGYPNPVTVKAYRNGDMSQESLSEEMPLEEGDTVLLEETLHTADADVPPDKFRMAYNYYRVTADATLPLYDWEEKGSYVENGSQVKNVDGFWGKSADEKVVRVTGNADAAFTYLETGETAYSATEKYPIVFECDFLAESHVKSVRFTTGWSPENTELYPGNNSAHDETNSTDGYEQPAGFLHGRWSKLKMVIDYTKGTGVTYINGVKAGEVDLNGASKEAYLKFKHQVRLQVTWDDSSTAESDKKFCVVNFKVYEQKNPKPEEEAISLSKTADGYLLLKDEISFFGGEITEDVKNEMGVSDVKVFDSEKNYTPVVEETALSDGNLIVMKNNAGTYGYYTVREHMLAADGTGYVDDATYTDGGLQFKATGGGTMIVAQYGNNGTLLKAQVQHLTEETPFVNLDPAEGAVSIKTFIFNSMSGLVPYMPAMELRYKASPDLTVACWGDSLTYGQGSSDVRLYSYPAVLKKQA